MRLPSGKPTVCYGCHGPCGSMIYLSFNGDITHSCRENLALSARCDVEHMWNVTLICIYKWRFPKIGWIGVPPFFIRFIFGLSVINHLDIGITLWQPPSGRPSHSPIVGDHIGAAPAQRSVGQSRAGTFEAPRREGGRFFSVKEKQNGKDATKKSDRKTSWTMLNRGNSSWTKWKNIWLWINTY